MENHDNIVFLDKSSKNMDKAELFEWLTECCTPVQIGIIMGHIDLLEDNMLIGYDTTNEDVFVLFVNEDEEQHKMCKISKK